MALPKALTGILGFDEITLGGLPAGRSTLICGNAGCGKTLFSMTFLLNGALKFDEPGVLMSFEEREEDLAANVASLGYDLNALTAAGKLTIDHVRLETGEIEENGEFDLEGLFLRIGFAVDSIGAKRVVLDTIEALFSGFTSPALVRSELRRLFGWLKDRHLTAVITGESGAAGLLTRHGLEEYVADCVILLDNRVQDQITTRRLRVMKYRGSSHGSDEYPFLIDSDGISVLPATSPRFNWPISNEIVPTGVHGLNAMLQTGGFHRGSSILLSGDAGSGKTTISNHFVDAACGRGERCLFFGFQESTEENFRNALSVGLDLQKWVTAGLLHLHVVQPSLYGLETHLAHMHRSLITFNPSIVVIDPISAFFGPSSEVNVLLKRMKYLLKNRGTTAMYTSTNGTPMDRNMGSMMDVWIKLMDIEANGERNHVLYLIKARGISHSNQLREYRMTDTGIKLMSAYLGAEGVLTGTARFVQEAREQANTTGRQQDIERRRRDLVRRREALEVQINGLRVALEDTEDEATMLLGQDDVREALLVSGNEAVAARRGTT